MNEISALSPAAQYCLIFLAFIFLLGLIIDSFLLIGLFSRTPDFAGMRRNILKRPWSWQDIALFIFFVMLVQIAIGYVTRAIFGEETVFNPQAVFIQTTALPLSIMILVFELSASQKWSLEKTFGIKFSSIFSDISRGIIAYAGIFPIFITGAFLYGYALNSIEYPVIHQEVVLWFVDHETPAWFKSYLVIMAVLVAPITEEVLFRGIALPVVMKHSRTSLAVIFVSLLFAAAHFHFSAALPLFILAVGLSVAYIYSGSLLVPVVMHSVFNGVMLLSTTFTHDYAF